MIYFSIIKQSEGVFLWNTHISYTCPQMDEKEETFCIAESPLVSK